MVTLTSPTAPPYAVCPSRVRALRSLAPGCTPHSRHVAFVHATRHALPGYRTVSPECGTVCLHAGVLRMSGASFFPVDRTQVDVLIWSQGSKGTSVLQVLNSPATLGYGASTVRARH